MIQDMKAIAEQVLAAIEEARSEDCTLRALKHALGRRKAIIEANAESLARAYLALLEKNAVLEDAVKFYADKETYGSNDASRTDGGECFDVVCFDFDRNLEPGKHFAGKLAREALEKARAIGAKDA